MSSPLVQYGAQTPDQVIAAMKDMTANEKYEHVLRFSGSVESGMLSIEGWVEKIWKRIEEDKRIWKDKHPTFYDLEQEFPAVRALISETKRARDRVQEAKAVIQKQWGMDVGLNLESKSSYELAALRKVARAGISYPDSIIMGQHAVLQRLSNPRKGISQALLPCPSDWFKVSTLVFPAKPIDPQLLTRLGLIIEDEKLFRASQSIGTIEDSALSPSSNKPLRVATAGLPSDEPVAEEPTNPEQTMIPDQGAHEAEAHTPEHITPPPAPRRRDSSSQTAVNSAKPSLPRDAKRPRPTEGEEKSTTRLIKRVRTKAAVCACKGPSDDWFEEVEGAIVRYDFVSGLYDFASWLYLAAPVFYAAWTICVDHIGHLLQHLGISPADDQREAMEILSEAWSRRYDFLIYRAEQPDLFRMRRTADGRDCD